MSNQVPESAQRYTSRPVTITAAQWDGTEEHARQLCDWADSYRGRGSACYIPAEPPLGGNLKGEPFTIDRPARIVIGTLEGHMDLLEGSWLIQGTEDEFYPCKDSVFQRKYAPEHTDTPTCPQIPAEMRDSLDARLENVRLLQRNLSVTTVQGPYGFIAPEERPKYVISSVIEVYGDFRG